LASHTDRIGLEVAMMRRRGSRHRPKDGRGPRRKRGRREAPWKAFLRFGQAAKKGWRFFWSAFGEHPFTEQALDFCFDAYSVNRPFGSSRERESPSLEKLWKPRKNPCPEPLQFGWIKRAQPANKKSDAFRRRFIPAGSAPALMARRRLKRSAVVRPP
jgi:hypothetical protein